MTDKKQSGDLPELDKLVRRYRETKAPLGFAQRVAAHIDKVQPVPWWTDTIAHITGSAKVLLALSMGVIVVLAILVVQLQTKPTPDLQVVERGKVQQPPLQAQDNSTSVAKIDAAFYQSSNSGGYANLAALSDVSVWLDEQTEPSVSDAPGLADMPELEDIEAAFDTT